MNKNQLKAGSPPNSNIHLTDKQLKYLAARSNGKSRTEAASLAGYGETIHPSAIEKAANLREALLRAFEMKGLTTEFLAEKIKKGCDSKKIYHGVFQGNIVSREVVDDNETSQKYVRTALEVRGDLSSREDKKINFSIGIEVPSVSETQECWSENVEKVLHQNSSSVTESEEKK